MLLNLILIVSIPVVLLIVAGYIIYKTGREQVGKQAYFIISPADNLEGERFDIRDVNGCRRFFRQHPRAKFQVMVDNKPMFPYSRDLKYFNHYVQF
jgi:hypothetical protein